ncbi:MAG: major facilitator super transporter protein [Vezdaea aestivalis]|nr:MAG: major facilitator super transporter protein [Vezdaea aestivalis]
MPRIKAITTGSIPSFLDVILNFAETDTSSTLANQDSWLAQLRKQGKHGLVMYGDDTWLKLFPQFFKRSDGTTSFFVSDFTEVDLNVTRHVPRELANDDWDAMVLHYLGLDHIGHKAGPQSSNMRPKQAEMDAIVQMIHEAMETKEHLRSTILVLCGDHGMNDAGNHGGSAPGETSPALVFISPKLNTLSAGQPSPVEVTDSEFSYYERVDQSDIAPTLSALLGIPVPRNNLGVVIPEFLPFWDDRGRSIILQRNLLQILNIVNTTFTGLLAQKKHETEHDCGSDVGAIACEFHRNLELLRRIEHSLASANKNEQTELLSFCRKAQETMSKTASNYNISNLSIGIFFAALSILSVSIHLGLYGVQVDYGTYAICVISLLYAPMVFASSYVEEEQHFCIRAIKRTSKVKAWVAWIALIVPQRIIQRWNQTGQKRAGEADIVKAFFTTHTTLLSLGVAIGYASILYRLAVRRSRTAATRFLAILACGSAFIFKLNFTVLDAPELVDPFFRSFLPLFRILSLVQQARIAHITALVLLLRSLQDYRVRKGSTPSEKSGLLRQIHDAISLWLLTQTRFANIPIQVLLQVQLHALESLDLSPSELTTTSLLFQYQTFFAFGGSNAISSIDLSSAYNGVSGYNVLAVGVLTFVGNWTGPIWWVSGVTTLLASQKERSGHVVSWSSHVALLSWFVSVSVLGVMAACMALRTHLFIWTVFSPKYLYVMAWTIAHHMGVNVLLGGLLWTLVA